MQLKRQIYKNLGQILAIILCLNCVEYGILHYPYGENEFHFLKQLPFLLLAEAELEDH